MTVEELNVVISAQTQEFKNALNGVNDRLDELEDHTKQYGESTANIFSTLAKAAAGLGIGKIISDSITDAGELEQNLGGVEVVFGNYADSMRDKAKTAFEDMGLSQSDYLAKANKMGALFKGSGFDAGYASSMSQQVMQRASDVASIMGVDVKDAMEAVTGAAKGNFTMMDNLGVAMNDTTLQAYAQEKGMGKLETTQQKVNAAMQMFLEKTEYAAGNYAKENDTFSGSLTTFKAQLADLSAELGSTLLPTATSLLSMARSGLEAVSPLITSVGSAINSVAQYIMGLPSSVQAVLAAAVAATVVIPMVTKSVGLLNTKIKTSTAWLMILTSVLAAIASVGAARRELDEGTGEELEQTSEGADNAAVSVDGLSESYEGLGESSEAAKKSLADIDNLNIFKSSAQSTGGIDFAAISSGAESTAEAVAGTTSEIAGLTDEMNGLNLDGLTDTFMTTFDDIGAGIDVMWKSFFGSGDEQYESLKIWNESIKGLFGEDWTNFFNNVGSNLYKIFNGNEYEKDQALAEVQGWLEDIDNAVKGFFGDFGEAWSDFFKSFGTKIQQAQNGVTNYLKEKGVTSYGDYVQKFFSGEVSLSGLYSAAFPELFPDSESKSGGGGRNRYSGSSTHISSSGETHGGGGGSYGFVSYDVPKSDYSSGYAAATRDLGALEGSSDNDKTLNLTITNMLDGVAVGEYSAEYSMRELARSNGY